VKKTYKYILSVTFLISFFGISELQANGDESKKSFNDSIFSQFIAIERPAVIKRADKLLFEKPITVTASFCSRSTGTKHDFYSEGPYWWPDPKNPKGSFLRNDGLRYPGRFVDNDEAMRRFSWIVSTETSAFLLTKDEKYARAVLMHLNAWFVNPETKMNPNMQYSQAIQGICTSRGIGIIDALPLMDVAQSIAVLKKSDFVTEQEIKPYLNWYKDFIVWMTTHQYGQDEMNAKNNHGSWWHAQMAVYARLVNDKKALELCRNHYEEILLPNQMAENGSFPLELERTKPYSYSLFNLDAFAAIVWILSDNSFNEWNFTMPDGRGLNHGLKFILPFLKDKSKWTYPKDVSHWDEQPEARPFMLFAAFAQQDGNWFKLWKTMTEKNDSDEARLGLTIRNPLLWIYLNNNNLK